MTLGRGEHGCCSKRAGRAAPACLWGHCCGHRLRPYLAGRGSSLSTLASGPDPSRVVSTQTKGTLFTELSDSDSEALHVRASKAACSKSNSHTPSHTNRSYTLHIHRQSPTRRHTHRQSSGGQSAEAELWSGVWTDGRWHRRPAPPPRRARARRSPQDFQMILQLQILIITRSSASWVRPRRRRPRAPA